MYAKEQFVIKAEKVHGNRYDYSQVDYINKRSKIIITCPIHGDFKQIPGNHLHGQGCRLCAIENSSKKKSMSTKEFISRATKVHRGFYGYDKVIYVNKRSTVDIVCPEHGVFTQNASMHLSGNGCSKCSRNGKLNTE